MYELRRLIDQSDPAVKQKSGRVQITRFRKTQDITFGKDSFGPFYKVAWQARSGGGGKGIKHHVCSVRFYDRLGTTSKVVAECDCADFKYRWDYALFLRDSSDLAHANSQKPRITNPTVRGGLCKHLLRVVQIIPVAQEWIKKRVKRKFPGKPASTAPVAT